MGDSVFKGEYTSLYEDFYTYMCISTPNINVHIGVPIKGISGRTILGQKIGKIQILINYRKINKY